MGCVCLVGLDTYSQGNEFMYLTKLESGQGLSSPNVRKILKDKYGFIWTATQDGLNRFDGFSFIHFSSNEADPRRTILENDVQDILLDDRGERIWALTSYGGLSSIDIATTSSVDRILLDSVIGYSSTGWYSCLARHRDTLLIGTRRGFLLCLDTKKQKTYQTFNVASQFGHYSRIDKLFVDRDGNTWIFSAGNGILVMDKQLSRVIKKIPQVELLTPGHQQDISFYDIIQFDPEHLVVATSDGVKTLSVINKTVLSNHALGTKFPARLPPGETFAVHYTAPYLYMAHANALYKCDLQQGSLTELIVSGNYSDKKWLNPVNCILAEGARLWLGNQLGLGWVKNTKNAFTQYKSSLDGANIELKHCYFIYPVNDSLVYTCSANGLYRSNPVSGAFTRIDDGQPYYHIFKTPTGELIASGEKSLLFLEPATKSSPVKKYPELAAINNDFIISSVPYNDSLIVLASQNKRGIYIWNVNKRTVEILNDVSVPVRLKSMLINRLFLDPAGTVWIVCDDLISKWNIRQQTMQHIEIHKPGSKTPMHILMDICGDGARKWLAIYGAGIAEIDNNAQVKKLISTPDGLTNLGVYKIFHVQDSLLYVTSNDGLFLYNLRREKLYRFIEADGLHSNNFEETSGNLYNGQLYAGGIYGYTKVDLQKVSFRFEKPVCYFTNIEIKKRNEVVKDTAGLFFSSLTVPNDAVQVTIHFTALYLSNPGKISFEYQLQELHSGWVNAGNKDFISLIGLAPGKYQLQVRAFNEDGSRSDPIEVTLVYLPKWYQTWWFKGLVALAFLAIGYLIYRVRMDQLAREEAIRKKLARDLHDDLGSTLNSVKVFANLAQLEKNNETHLSRIKESITDAIVSIRDIIWVLDDKKDSVDHLITRILQFAEPLCDANGIALQQSISAAAYNYQLGKEEKRNLYMIIKETINNSIKYASCKKISLDFSIHAGRLQINVSDDGIGFNPVTTVPGNGTRNIYTRATAAGYKASIISAPGKGTTVTLLKN